MMASQIQKVSRIRNPIFIIGLPRSGSTLWANIIAKNPEILRLAEILFLTPWRKDFRYFCKKRVGDLSDDKNIKKMIAMIFSDRLIPGITGVFWINNIRWVNNNDFKERLRDTILASDRSIGSIFKILIEEITFYRGYSRCCVKFPVFINHLSQLMDWYPQSKIIHITRDPRATALSRMNYRGASLHNILNNRLSGFLKSIIMLCLFLYQYNWSSRLHLQYQHLENYALFRNEDLLVNPEKTIRAVCKFAELDFVDEMLSPDEGQPSSITGKKSKKFDKEAAKRWQAMISPFENRFITWMTQKSMERFGYDPINHPIYCNE